MMRGQASFKHTAVHIPTKKYLGSACSYQNLDVTHFTNVDVALFAHESLVFCVAAGNEVCESSEAPLVQLCTGYYVLEIL